MPASAAPSELRAAPLVAALALAGAAGAQATSCSLTDLACVEQEYPLVCFDDEQELRLTPCLEWLAEIERSPSVDVRLAAASRYLSIRDFAPPGVHAELAARSARLLHGVLEEHPNHPRALLALADLAETDEERVRRLRDVVAVAPTPRTLEFLASAIAFESREGTLEAAALHERGYEIAVSSQPGDFAFRFARDAIWLYEQGGAPERAESLRRRVARLRSTEAIITVE